MKNILVLVASLFIVTTGYCAETDSQSSAKQAQLDSQCEEARQVALGPMRQVVYQECLEKGKDEQTCKSESDAYNGARAGRGPLFYDLPECQTAFDYRKNH